MEYATYKIRVLSELSVHRCAFFLDSTVKSVFNLFLPKMLILKYLKNKFLLLVLMKFAGVIL